MACREIAGTGASEDDGIVVGAERASVGALICLSCVKYEAAAGVMSDKMLQPAHILTSDLSNLSYIKQDTAIATVHRITPTHVASEI